MSLPLHYLRPAAQGFAAGLLLAIAGCGVSSKPDVTAAEPASPSGVLIPAPAPIPVAPQVQSEALRADAVVSKRSMSRPMMTAPMMAADQQPAGYRDESREQYQTLPDNPIHSVAQAPVSTFSADVDTGGYANVRRLLNQGSLPPKVRCAWRKWSITSPTTTHCPAMVRPLA